MPRLVSAIAAALLLAGCESSTSSEPAPSEPSAQPQPAEVETPSLCRADEVVALAQALEGGGAKTRRDGVVGLKEACELPKGLEALLGSTEDRPGPDPEAELLSLLCEGNESSIAEAATLAPGERARVLYDRCGLGRLGLIERDAWLRSNPTTVIPFATMAWLEQQGVAEDDAKTIASAILLRAQRTWGVPSQQVPVVGGVLAAVPPAAIEVAVTPEAVYVEGAKVLELVDGKLPKASKDGDPMKAFERALLAEREAEGESAAVTIAIVADARVPTGALLRFADAAPEGAAVAWVVQAEPLSYGMLTFNVGHLGHGQPELAIDGGGFTLTPAGGGTKQRIGPGDEANPYDFEALAAKAREYIESRRGTPRDVVLDVAEGTPASVLLSAIHQLKGESCVDDVTTCWFKDVSVKHGFDPETMARNAGILGVLSAESGAFLASPYGTAFDVDPDEDVWGGLIGTEIGEGFGVGGLGLVGEGRGGGGTGEGTIGLGNVGGIGKGSSVEGEVSRPKVPRVRQAKATVKGSLDKDIIRRIVRAHVNEVRYCYEVGLEKDEELEGRVVIDFTIGTDGKVSKAEVDSTTVDDEAIGTCIAKKVKRWKFPKPTGGGLVLVSYPFVLSPG